VGGVFDGSSEREQDHRIRTAPILVSGRRYSGFDMAFRFFVIALKTVSMQSTINNAENNNPKHGPRNKSPI
jgi:hypothetical protein